ncbi:MAG TPA: hypothetical protein PK297_10840, partial [Spirochaetota bacterium]|nr:hypothetical protein [Spirochaetota bacterium]
MEITKRVEALREGDVLARSVTSGDGSLVLEKGLRLDSMIIERIRNSGMAGVPVLQILDAQQSQDDSQRKVPQSFTF